MGFSDIFSFFVMCFIPIGETRDGRSDLTNVEMDLLDTRMVTTTESSHPCRNSYIRPSCFPISLVILFVLLVVLFPVIQDDFNQPSEPVEFCNRSEQCEIHLVESIPDNLTYPSGSPVHMTTFEAWKKLIVSAQKSIQLGAFYWTLRGKDVYVDPSDYQGEEIFKLLVEKGRLGNVTINIAQNAGAADQLLDSSYLSSEGLAVVRNLNFTRWFGGGVLHTKMWLVDGKHFYVGSANMDWRSLTQVKELGIAAFNCSCLAKDLSKTFDVYWHMGETNSTEIPTSWPSHYSTPYNFTHPQVVNLNGSESAVFISSSPPQFCPHNRESDINAILSVINSSKQFVHIAVMDYSPTTLYGHPRRFWPIIDSALRKVAFERGIQVKLLASHWNHSRPEMLKFLSSLAALNQTFSKGGIQVKLFVVPTVTVAQAKIPFGRVNHNKYLVTDNTAYIGTSNWSADYFIDTAGVGLIIRQNDSDDDFSRSPIVTQLQQVFMRDWTSSYAIPIENFITADHRNAD